MTYVPPRRSGGTIQVRRTQQHWPEGSPFRILSIDGGGICGILPSAILAELEDRFLEGRSISNYFDMIVGTSTGGLIALALSLGLTSRQILRFYLDRGDRIFPNSGCLMSLRRWLRRLHRSAYDSSALEQELLDLFGDTPFGDAKVRLCIPSFEGVHGEPWIFKTPHHPDYRKDRFERMVKVALATAAAPTYFRAVPNNGYIMIDGGIWAKNPIMNAIVDALSCFDLQRKQIQVLSLGCGETSFKVDAGLAEGGLFQWKNVIRAAVRAQSHNALGQSYLLLGKENVVRIDAPERMNPIAMDDHRRAKAELPLMARSLVEGAGHLVRSKFLGELATEYHPCPMPGAK